MTLLWKYFNTQNKCDKPKMFFLKLQMDMSDRNLYIFQFEKEEWKLHIYVLRIFSLNVKNLAWDLKEFGLGF
jgi:hypothetical protein